MAYRQASAFVSAFFDTNGLPLSGGTIKSYLAGTTTTTAMYTDSSGTSAGATITLNSRGEPEVSSNTVNIWLDEALSYKFVLADSAGASIWTVDNVNVGIASGALDILGATPLINFKTSAAGSYDTRIAQLTNGLGFYTGGNGATVLGMLLDQNRYLLLDPAGAGGSPSVPLHIKGSTNDYPIKVESTDATAGIQFADSATTGVVGVAAVGDNIALVGSKIGIGTTSPIHDLGIGEQLFGIDAGTASPNAGYIRFGDTSGWKLHIGRTRESVGGPNNTGDTGSIITVLDTGNLLVGTTSATWSAGQAGFRVNNAGQASQYVTITNTSTSASDETLLIARGNVTNAEMIQFYNNSNAVGTITTSASATAYNTSSDYRLKEDIKPVENATDRLLKLNPVNFAWKSDGTRVDGFLAHEAQEVVPEAVTGEKDGMRTEEYTATPALGDIYDQEEIIKRNVERPEELKDGQQWRETSEEVKAEREVEDYQGIDQAKLVPLLVKTAQELEARIKKLEG